MRINPVELTGHDLLLDVLVTSETLSLAYLAVRQSSRHTPIHLGQTNC